MTYIVGEVVDIELLVFTVLVVLQEGIEIKFADGAIFIIVINLEGHLDKFMLLVIHQLFHMVAVHIEGIVLCELKQGDNALSDGSLVLLRNVGSQFSFSKSSSFDAGSFLLTTHPLEEIGDWSLSRSVDLKRLLIGVFFQEHRYKQLLLPLSKNLLSDRGACRALCRSPSFLCQGSLDHLSDCVSIGSGTTAELPSLGGFHIVRDVGILLRKLRTSTLFNLF